MIPLVSIYDEPICGEEEVLVDEYCQVTKAIEGRRWEQFLQLMASGHVSVEDCDTDLLHTLCAHRPPNHIVERILKKNPSLVSSRDCEMRTPLHVAIECGASSGVIRRLLSVDPTAAELKDSEGRTPLILACGEMGREEYESKEHEKLRVHRLTKAIRLMAQIAPQSSIIEDDDEMTALEHAISCDAPIEIVKELQKVTARSMMQVDRRRRRHTMDVASPVSYESTSDSSNDESAFFSERRQSRRSAMSL
uniref:Uncharacterized protein n=1 Tax=Pseudictyota dubia TaxID=2749911 RepID=A0A6U2DN02_9STRA|mmetsp:Transcript_30751/g.56919  ORF Transcript_30751/g.56919 Transcript_30751/m.56919 type:complete len:250 (+) Transcript_30751:157-906(+)